MKTILYIGMDNNPIEIEIKYTIKNYELIETYFTLDGKKFMLKAINNAYAYHNPSNYMQYIKNSQTAIEKGSIVSPSVINKGYSCHDFEIVIV